jgi:hypothetical protein
MTVPGRIAKPNGWHRIESAIQDARERGDPPALRRFQAQARRLSSIETWIILLDERITDEGEEVTMGIIAHEIAHAWLKHDRHHYATPPECEIEAADLAKAWGFTGRGADADYCHAPFVGAGRMGFDT